MSDAVDIDALRRLSQTRYECYEKYLTMYNDLKRKADALEVVASTLLVSTSRHYAGVWDDIEQDRKALSNALRIYRGEIK